MGYLCANFSLPRPLYSRVIRPDVRDRQTSDVRQKHRLMPPSYGGGDIISKCNKLLFKFVDGSGTYFYSICAIGSGDMENPIKTFAVEGLSPKIYVLLPFSHIWTLEGPLFQGGTCSTPCMCWPMEYNPSLLNCTTTWKRASAVLYKTPNCCIYAAVIFTCAP